MKLVTHVATLAIAAFAATTPLKALNNAAVQEDSQQATAAASDYAKKTAASGKDVT